MPVHTIKSFDEFDQAINSGKPVVIDFWADWCGPCKMISPYFERFSEVYSKEDVDFYKVDVDDQEQVAAVVGIRAMPTFVAFKDGKRVKDVVGANPLKLKELVDFAAKGLPRL